MKPCIAALALLTLRLGSAAAQEAPPSASTPTATAPKVHVEMSAAAEMAEFVGASMCLSCHSEKETFKHNLHAKTLLNAKGVEFEKTCETCHGPGSLHAGAGGDKNNSGFWTIKNPSKLKPAEASATCLKCHSGGERMHWAGSVHDLKNVSCTNCHSMHDVKANKGEAPLLAKATQTQVCFQCHAEKKAQIRKSAHMPLVEGKMGCASCHNPHGSTGERLMAKSSVTETCYQCHEDKRGPFLWEHPPVRENCLNCHDPHGSHHEKMLITKQPLLCQRCHVGTRHPTSLYDFTQEAKQSVKLLDRGCANCHSKIHGSNHPSGKYLHR